MSLQDYTPKKIEQIMDKEPKAVVTADRWNELWNLVISQGDDTAEHLYQTIQKVLDLEDEMEEVVLGSIPEGSITDAKLSNDSGHIKNTVNNHINHPNPHNIDKSTMGLENVDNMGIEDIRDGVSTSHLGIEDKIIKEKGSVKVDGYGDAPDSASYYIRFTDGTQICWTDMRPFNTPNPHGSSYYRSNTWIWFFPKKFKDDKYFVTGSINRTGGGIHIGRLSSDRMTYKVYTRVKMDPFDGTYYWLYTIGRWK